MRHSSPYGSSYPHPFVRIMEQPLERGFRFRYKSEAGAHGGLPAESSHRNHKKYPTIKIENYIGPSRVEVTLMTNEPEPRLHVHRLAGKNCEEGICHVKALPENDMIICFQNLGILHVPKKEVPEILYERLEEEFKIQKMMSQRHHGNYDLTEAECNMIRQNAEENAKTMELNVVKLCFQAYIIDNQGNEIPLPPVLSTPVFDSKSPNTAGLKICRMDKQAGYCAGNEEIFLLCDRVQKDDISVRFFELDERGKEIWHDYGKFTIHDVHKQYAIVFRTPAFKTQSLSKPVRVFVQLQKKKDGLTSEAKPFTFRPIPNLDEPVVGNKRQKLKLTINDLEILNDALCMIENCNSSKHSASTCKLKNSSIAAVNGNGSQNELPNSTTNGIHDKQNGNLTMCSNKSGSGDEYSPYDSVNNDLEYFPQIKREGGRRGLKETLVEECHHGYHDKKYDRIIKYADTRYSLVKDSMGNVIDPEQYCRNDTLTKCDTIRGSGDYDMPPQHHRMGNDSIYSYTDSKPKLEEIGNKSNLLSSEFYINRPDGSHYGENYMETEEDHQTGLKPPRLEVGKGARNALTYTNSNCVDTTAINHHEDFTYGQYYALKLDDGGNVHFPEGHHNHPYSYGSGDFKKMRNPLNFGGRIYYREEGDEEEAFINQRGGSYYHNNVNNYDNEKGDTPIEQSPKICRFQSIQPQLQLQKPTNKNINHPGYSDLGEHFSAASVTLNSGGTRRMNKKFLDMGTTIGGGGGGGGNCYSPSNNSAQISSARTSSNRNDISSTVVGGRWCYSSIRDAADDGAEREVRERSNSIIPTKDYGTTLHNNRNERDANVTKQQPECTPLLRARGHKVSSSVNKCKRIGSEEDIKSIWDMINKFSGLNCLENGPEISVSSPSTAETLSNHLNTNSSDSVSVDSGLDESSRESNSSNIEIGAPSLNSHRISNKINVQGADLHKGLSESALVGNFVPFLSIFVPYLALPDAVGNTPLHIALAQRNESIAMEMLIASIKGNISLAKHILSFYNDRQKTPLHLIVETNYAKHFHVALTALKPSLSLLDGHGNNVFHLAALKGSLDILYYLKFVIVTTSKKDDLRLPSINSELITKLVNEINYEGEAPIHLATISNDLGTLKAILTIPGVDVNKGNGKCGKSSLHLAVEQQSLELTTILLLQESIDVNSKDYNGLTALDMVNDVGDKCESAAFDIRTKLVCLLKKSGCKPGLPIFDTNENQCKPNKDLQISGNTSTSDSSSDDEEDLKEVSNSKNTSEIDDPNNITVSKNVTTLISSS